MLPPMGAAETAEPFLVVHADAADPAAHPTERAIMLLLACVRKLIGAGLDVFEQEPLPADLPLTAMEHVVLTAHSASCFRSGVREPEARVAHAAVDMMEGRRPEFVAHPDVVPQRGPLSPRP